MRLNLNINQPPPSKDTSTHLSGQDDSRGLCKWFQEQPPGLVVYEVFATDEDEGVNGEVRYSFLQTGAGNRDWENFHIDAVTGVITTAVKLDREKQALYSVSTASLSLFPTWFIWLCEVYHQ